MENDTDFVDIQTVNPRILIDIRYATANNFVGRAVYSSAKCFLRRKVAKKLDLIQKKLEKIGLGLKVWDGYRPFSVQKIFWEILPDPRYVAPPNEGSRHNRGAAVDLTLVDKEGKELKMPTEFDDFSEKAHSHYDRLPKEVIHNRTLLHNIMREHGLIPFVTEWWHFDDEEGEKFPIEDKTFEELK
ncbi:MAG: D-alanyl-D-alanine dipeptidase [Candidatus Melainabacteria bacterium]|nr:D-alanyl-D-alanine dipeptidase [Candidatus Melainabacteria bacterium]